MTFFHPVRILCLTLALTLATACSVYTKPQKVDSYLHYVEYEKYNFEKLSKTADFLFDGKKNMPSAACSAVRKDSLFGRNFDWYYDYMPEFVIAAGRDSTRYASIGIAAPISVMKEKQIGSLWGSIVLNLLPLFTVDGINENGVTCCVNVVPQGDCGFIVGTNPGKPRMYAAVLVRYILDHASSAAEAVSFLDDFDIYTSTAFGMKEDYHFMIADSLDNYVVEFIDNKAKVLDTENIMTNFYLSAGVTPHAIGVERYDILREGYSEVSDGEDLYNLMKSVWFSGMYDDTRSPLWLSELCSANEPYGLVNADIPTGSPKVMEAFEAERKLYLERTREKAKTWQTVHTSVYNIYTKTLTVYPQEGTAGYKFPLQISLTGER